MTTNRRTFLQTAAAASLLYALPARAAPMKIGVIGAGRVRSVTARELRSILGLAR